MTVHDAPFDPGRRFRPAQAAPLDRPLKGLAAAFRRLAGGLSRWRRRRRAIRELQALSKHHLADIGLERAQIVSTVEALLEARDRPE